MSQVVVHPSTMEGIKRLAKSLKREKNLSHAKALDAAAQAAGFQNLQHARNVLPKMRVGSNRLRPLYLSAYWRTPEGQTGRDTLAPYPYASVLAGTPEAPAAVRVAATPFPYRRGRSLGNPLGLAWAVCSPGRSVRCGRDDPVHGSVGIAA